MLAQQYAHRLPADYDMAAIRRRVQARGPLWDATPGLAFKAFVVQERGRHGAIGNLYASVYLWHDASAAADMVTDDRFQAVIDGFGRPAVELWLPVAQARGEGTAARTLYREDIAIAHGENLAGLRASERRRATETSALPGTVATVSAFDVGAWNLVRLTLTAEAPDPALPGSVYEVLHLAHPGLAQVR